MTRGWGNGKERLNVNTISTCVRAGMRRPMRVSHPGDVNLADHVFPRRNVSTRPGDEDAFALAAAVRLTDVRLALLGPGVRLEVTVTAERARRR